MPNTHLLAQERILTSEMLRETEELRIRQFAEMWWLLLVRWYTILALPR